MPRIIKKILTGLILMGCSLSKPSPQRPGAAIEITLSFSGPAMETATGALRSFVLKDSLNPAPRYDAGVILDSLGWTDSAMAFYRETIALDPSHADARYNLACDFHSSGQFDSAFFYFKTADSLAPGAEDARHNLTLACDTLIGVWRHRLGFSTDSLELLKRASRELNACAEVRTFRAPEALDLLSTVYERMASGHQDSTPLSTLLVRQDLYRRAIETVLVSKRVDSLLGGDTEAGWKTRVPALFAKLASNAGETMERIEAASAPADLEEGPLARHLFQFQTLQASREFAEGEKKWLMEKAPFFPAPMERLYSGLMANAVASEARLISDITGQAPGSETWLNLSDLHAEWMAFRRSLSLNAAGFAAREQALAPGLALLIAQEGESIVRLKVELDSLQNVQEIILESDDFK